MAGARYGHARRLLYELAFIREILLSVHRFFDDELTARALCGRKSVLIIILNTSSGEDWTE